jgi:hypothetical protein
MRFRGGCALLLLLFACATTEPRLNAPMAHNPRIANLQRAAALPWRDEGQCVVQEASQPWPVVVERCFHALDTSRVRFNDTEGVCSVASAGALTVPAMVGICLLSQPYLVVGAVVVIGVVVAATVIAQELEEHQRMRRAHPEAEDSSEVTRSVPQAQRSPQEPLANGRPRPEGLGRDWFPPEPPESTEPRDRRSECTPRRVPPKGGHPFHNTCADNIPHNAFRGSNALVNGKAFDALQLPARILWEVKTDNFDTYTEALQEIVISDQVPKLRLELELARACGFDFRIGVRSAAHKAALEREARDLRGLIVVMDWC